MPASPSNVLGKREVEFDGLPEIRIGSISLSGIVQTGLFRFSASIGSRRDWDAVCWGSLVGGVVLVVMLLVLLLGGSEAAWFCNAWLAFFRWLCRSKLGLARCKQHELVKAKRGGALTTKPALSFAILYPTTLKVAHFAHHRRAIAWEYAM